MKRILFAVFVIVVLMVSMLAQADRIEDITKAYENLKIDRSELIAKVAKADENLIRLEGMFSERNLAIEEQRIAEADAAKAAEEAVEEVVEEEIIIEEVVEGAEE